MATFDNRGVAPSSSPPAPYSVDVMADDTLGLLDHLGWADPVRVAGHSMGGWIAETLVLDHPGRDPRGRAHGQRQQADGLGDRHHDGRA